MSSIFAARAALHAPGKLSLLTLALLAAAVVARGGVKVVNVDEATPSEEQASSMRSAVLELNRFTFRGNVLQKRGVEEHVENWIISFCPPWWEPCQNLAPVFGQFGGMWERKLNTALLTSQVRFAAVDCATDKVLCNEQSVETYPTVHHYHKGKRVATFAGGRQGDADRLAKWLGKRLDGLSAVAAPADAAGEAASSKGWRFAPGDRALDLSLVLLVLALNCWAVCSNPQLWQKSAAGAPVKAAGVAPAAAVAASEREAQLAPSVARFLPQEWASPSRGLEL